jgi:predicted amidohydrolase
MIVSAIQYAPPKGDPAQARGDLQSMTEEAARNGARLIVLPEMATSGYVWESTDEILPHAERADGLTFSMLAKTAKYFQSWIICGYPENDDGILYNSAMIIDDSGKLAANYRKCLLFDADKSWASPGDTRVSINTSFGVMTPGICMDLNDDGFIDYLEQVKPAFIPFCTNWIEEGLDVHWYWNARLEGISGVLIAANRWGTDGNIEFCGRSVIMRPGSEPLVQAPGTGDTILYAEIDPAMSGSHSSFSS